MLTPTGIPERCGLGSWGRAFGRIPNGCGEQRQCLMDGRQHSATANNCHDGRTTWNNSRKDVTPHILNFYARFTYDHTIVDWNFVSDGKDRSGKVCAGQLSALSNFWPCPIIPTRNRQGFCSESWPLAVFCCCTTPGGVRGFGCKTLSRDSVLEQTQHIFSKNAFQEGHLSLNSKSRDEWQYQIPRGKQIKPRPKFP
jgi:hypothetical protein